MTATRTFVLRTCSADGSSYGGFRWPLKVGATVEAPDWNPHPSINCGQGLHGLLLGEGDPTLLSWDADAVWQVVDAEDVVPSSGGGKVRFRRGTLVYVGDRIGAVADIVGRGADPEKVVGGLVTVGDLGTANAGYRGTANAGDRGTANAGADGIIQVRRWDGVANRYRIETAYVGEDGIEPNVPYRLTADGQWERADDDATEATE